jgi:hypothetical protein
LNAPSPIARRGVIRVDHATPAVFQFARKLTGFNKWLDDGGLLFEASGKHVELWKAHFPEWPLEDADGTLAKLELVYAPVAQTPRLLPWGGPQAVAEGKKPWDHQNRAHSQAMSRDFFAFFHDMGTGKTATMIALIAELYTRGVLTRAVISTTRLGATQLIEDQLPYWMPAGINYRVAQMGSTKAKNFAFAHQGYLLILVCTPACFESARLAEGIATFARGRASRPSDHMKLSGRVMKAKAPAPGTTPAASPKKPAHARPAPSVAPKTPDDTGPPPACAIFIDESQGFKGWDTKRVDNLLALRPLFSRRYLFSGEPSPNGYQDFFAQFYFLDANIIGHESLTSFRNEYCIMGGYQFKEVMDYHNTNELMARIAPHCEFVKITDVMDMPERAWIPMKYKPTDRQLELYNQLKTDYVAIVTRATEEKDPEILKKTCKNAASRLTAMQQVSCGFLYTDLAHEDAPREIVRITDDRAWFTLEELANRSEKTLIWARYHEDLAMLHEVAAAMGIDAAEMSGRVNPKVADLNKQRFLTDPKCKFFFGTTASAGESLNLQISRRSIYHSNTFRAPHMARRAAQPL